jgi:hypothetical protein
MEETYKCELCNKEYNILNKIKNQIKCKQFRNRKCSAIKMYSNFI